LADVFISYARPDHDRIEKLAAALETQGFSVWWDRQIEAGAAFSKDIERELHGAKAVIVCWSAAAGASDWVKDEASAAREQGKLIPVRLDVERPPLGFRQYQTLDFSGWKGGANAPVLRTLFSTIRSRVGGGGAMPDAVSLTSPSGKTPSALGLADTGILAAGALAVIAVITLIVLATTRSGDRQETAAASGAIEQQTGAPGAAEPVAAGVGLAVLPFVNLSSDPEQEYFADGLTEELLNWLANVEGLNVPGRTSSFRFKGKQDDMRVIAKSLNVRYLLEGSVRRSGDALRITAQLIEAENGFQVWSETYDRELADIFAIQDEISRLVVTELLGAIPESGAGNPAAVGDVDAKAHEFYLEGRALWGMRKDAEAYGKFQAAGERDPDHALAQAYIAVIGAHAIYNGGQLDVNDANPRSTMNTALANAVALQPASADVLFAQGWVAEFSAPAGPQSAAGVQAAIAYYKRAVRANPRHVEALHALARNEPDVQRQSELYKRVIDIDFGLLSARYNLADLYLMRGDFDAAFQLVDRAYALIPDNADNEGYVVARNAGDIERAASYMFRDWDGPGVNVWTLPIRAAVLADLGAEEEAIFLFAQTEDAQTQDAMALVNIIMSNRLAGNTQEEIRLAKRLHANEKSPPWSNVLLAETLLRAGDALAALDLVLEVRPDLAGPDGPRIKFGRFNNIGDGEAYAAAIALENLGRHDEARRIWSSVLEAANSAMDFSWRPHLNRAAAHAWLGATPEAMAELEAAYDKGFRSIRSFNCYTCVDNSFYEAGGNLEPLLEEPAFQRMVQRIENDNAATLARLEKRYGVLTRVREMMAAEAGASKE